MIYNDFTKSPDVRPEVYNDQDYSFGMRRATRAVAILGALAVAGTVIWLGLF